MKAALEIFGFVLCAVLGQIYGYTVSIGEGGKLQIPRADILSREDEAAILDLWSKLSESRQNVDNGMSNRSLYRTDSPEATTHLPSPEDSWSIVWYIASFSGLIAFFLIVSCSEWCCRKHVRVSSAPPPRSTPPSASASQTSVVQETPPPAYDLFAPPSYESLTAAAAAASSTTPGEKSEFDVYVVPVHAIGSVLGGEREERRPDDPPSYSAVNLSYVSETSA